MITCFVRYTVDPAKLDAFEAYARAWIPIVNSLGGTHHGYFLPAGDGDDVALALFSFPSVDEFKAYRRKRDEDPRCKAALAIAESSECILSFDAKLKRRVLPGEEEGPEPRQ